MSNRYETVVLALLGRCDSCVRTYASSCLPAFWPSRFARRCKMRAEMGRRRCRTTLRRARSAARVRSHSNLLLSISPPFGLLARLVGLKWGENGPAQIRTAVTATRRPKDTRLPHRPAKVVRPARLLTLPNTTASRQPHRTPHPSKYRSRCRRHPGLNAAPHAGHASPHPRYARAVSVDPHRPHNTAGSSNRSRGHGSNRWSVTSS